MARKVAARSKRSRGSSSRGASAGPWSRREVLALLRAWGEIARGPATALKMIVDAGAALLFEKFQQEMIGEADDDGDLPPTRRTKDTVRTKMKRIELSFKSIQAYLKRRQQLPAPHLGCAALLVVVASTREDWFALSKEQQLNALASITPGLSRSSFAEMDKEAFGLIEMASRETADEVKKHSSDSAARCRDPRTKWSTLDVQNLVRACREALELNPNVRPNPCGEQMQCMTNSVEQGNAQRQLSQNRVWQVLGDFQEETRSDRGEILKGIRRVQDEQRRDRADILRILETLNQV